MGAEIKQGSTSVIGQNITIQDDKSGNTMLYADQYNIAGSILRFQITRTTFGNAIVGYLPANAIPTRLNYYGAGTSNAASTANIIVGVDTTTNYFLTATNVQAAVTGLGQQTPQSPNAVQNLWQALAAGVDHPVTASYAENATSTTGGPWSFELHFDLN